MTEIILIIIIWIMLGVFINLKTEWWKEEYNKEIRALLAIFTILLSPIVFLYDFVNRMFIQKWH